MEEQDWSGGGDAGERFEPAGAGSGDRVGGAGGEAPAGVDRGPAGARPQPRARPDERALLGRVDADLRAFETVDWRQAAEVDPDAAREGWAAYQQALEDRARLAAALGPQARPGEMGQDAMGLDGAGQEGPQAVSLERGHAELTRDVPGWSPELADELASFAMDRFGFTPQELDTVTDPRLVKLLHRAYGGAMGEARAARMRAGQATSPAPSLSSGRGRTDVAPDTEDFAAFEKMADARMRAR